MKPHFGNLIALAAYCLLMIGCAQTGPPLPPSLELPKPPSDLRAVRKGSHVTLTWSQPTLTTDRQSVRYIGPTLVCRSAESEMTACADQAAVLPAPSIPPPKAEAGRPAPRTYVDTLPTNLQPQDSWAEMTYAVEVLNRNARGAGPSNRVHVPAMATLPPPGDFSAQLTGDGVVLTWTAISKSPDSTGIRHQYRIYRRDEASGKDAIAGEGPLGDLGSDRLVDSSFEWERTYLYRITVVSVGRWRPSDCRRVESEDASSPDCTKEAFIEGEDSPPVRVVAHDIFPPNVPAGLQAAYSGQGQKPFIDLIWAPVTNSDLAGYNVYRSEANGSAIKLNSELVKSPSYRDGTVTSGKTYTYWVSSVDVRKNESQRSEPASETAP